MNLKGFRFEPMLELAVKTHNLSLLLAVETPNMSCFSFILGIYTLLRVQTQQLTIR